MKTKEGYTPGPWTLGRRVAADEHDSRGDAIEISGDGWFSFARVVVRLDDEEDDHPEGLANARLIAAAPALLEALKDAALNLDACAVAIKKGGKSEGRHILAEGWAERAREAISLATGGRGNG